MSLLTILVFALNCCDNEFSFFEIFEDDLTEETDFILLAGVTDPIKILQYYIIIIKKKSPF